MSTVALIQRATSRHRRYYLEALRDLEAVTAVAVVDADGSTFAEAQETVPGKPVRTYATIEQLLRAEEPALAIVTLTGAESPAAISPVLEAGVPVLAEKPACVSPDGFAQLVETAERHHAHLMVALCNRLAPWAQDARRIVRQAGIGTLYAARAMVLADQARIWHPRTRDWTFRQADAGGGHLIWLGIHWLDLLLSLSGARVVEVQALVANAGGGPIDVEDLATVNLRLAGGALASLVSGYVLDAATTGKQMDLSLWGSQGWLRFDMESRTLEWHSSAAGMNEAPHRRFHYDSTGGGYTPFVRDCLRASLGEIPPPITAAEGLDALRVIFAAYRSAETGQTVRL
ncbi:MAG: Gfo/Idh/MocA family protein [Chloroflexota bacterium]